MHCINNFKGKNSREIKINALPQGVVNKICTLKKYSKEKHLLNENGKTANKDIIYSHIYKIWKAKY